MTKSELIKKVAEENNLPASNVKFAVDAFLNAVKEDVLENGRVALSGFGIFKKHVSAERMGRNPGTGEPVKIHSKTSIKFKQSE